MNIVNTISNYRLEIMKRFLLFMPKMILIMLVMYLAAFIIVASNYKKKLISKEDFYNLLFINEIIFFAKNYKSIIYIFLVNQIYSKGLRQ